MPVPGLPLGALQHIPRPLLAAGRLPVRIPHPLLSALEERLVGAPALPCLQECLSLLHMSVGLRRPQLGCL